VLYVLSGLLVASGLLRLGDEAGQAYANGNAAAENTATALTGECANETETAALLAAFQDREERLSLRESQIADRMQAMRVAEATIAERLEALSAAEATLTATLALASSAAQDDLGQLTSVYENMKPKDAAALFEEMTPEFAAGFLGRMRPDAAAAIMAGLEPTTGYSISVVLAGRNANVPTE
jgi:flagellar motility protein MotE (MotC chaperone)